MTRSRNLLENPDGLALDKTRTKLGWRDEDALAFMVVASHWVLMTVPGSWRAKAHFDLAHCVRDAADAAKNFKNLTVGDDTETFIMAGTLPAVSIRPGVSGEELMQLHTILSGSTSMWDATNKKVPTGQSGGHVAIRVGKQLVSGRLWTDSKIISFWNQHAQAIKDLPRLVSALTSQEGSFDHDVWSVEFPDWDGQLIPLSSALGGQTPSSGKKSDDEIKAMQRAQHLDPRAKAALGKEGAGSMVAARRASPQMVAQRNFHQVVGDSKIATEVVKTLLDSTQV